MTNPHHLDTDSIIESAHIAAGADNMVDEGLRARVDALAGSFRAAASGFSPDQAIATRRQIVKLLARRIGIAIDVARHPEILDEDVAGPIFVIGFMRTGTSVLQALLAADPANQGAQAWQTREPSPPPGERPVAPFRRRMADEEVWRFVERSQGLIALHPYWDEGAATLIEDEEIFSLDFRNSYPTLLYDAPSLGYMKSDPDADGMYAFLRLFMQHQQWQLPRRRWALKGVDHQKHIAALLRAFPDARCVFAHREPGEFLPSGMAITATLYDGVTSGSVSRKAIGGVIISDFRERLAAIAADPALDDPRITHLQFRDFIGDPVGTLRRCYGEWGFAWSHEGEAAMRAWLANPGNSSDRYGRHKYTFEPFGIDWNEHSPAFDAYRSRFLKG